MNKLLLILLICVLFVTPTYLVCRYYYAPSPNLLLVEAVTSIGVMLAATVSILLMIHRQAKEMIRKIWKLDLP